ncbi:hypothetical protein [Marinifilum flexuosum]|uniref:Uncharacterized protein n=1 Tax=Marinifilum flexuosum TaxID=1117708 RepID=A0A419WXA3_9BACT|nr:hypothetical protein [Marinifilum flexuosum]RKE00078.1 hypothetical protein BXY64_3074 [Marinifilum flexuosum]
MRPAKCIALINIERADINNEHAGGRSHDADGRWERAVINIDGADINIERALGRSHDADGRQERALINNEGNIGRS